MDHLSFMFSLLLIVSVTSTSLGSAIKAKNPNGEVNWTELTYTFGCLKNVVRAGPDSFLLASYTIFRKHCVIGGPDGSCDQQTYVNAS